MDSTSKVRISFIVLGLIIAVTGLHLQFTYSQHQFYESFIFFVGAGIALAGHRYKKGDKLWFRNKRESISSPYSVVVLTGLVIFFVGLAIGFIGILENSGFAFEVFIILLVLSLILLFWHVLLRQRKNR